jgi:prepilin-type processing-associated H-X9-DG protein
MHPGGAQVLFVDGSVRFLSQHMDSGAYAALATRAGGEIVSTTQF